MSDIITECRNENTKDIDILSTIEMVKKMNEEDKLVALAVEEELENIAAAVDLIAKQFLKGGRLFYFGAGTSGRLGILDASECPPTFSVPDDMVQGIICGGDRAMRKSVEGAEDDFELGCKDAEVLTDNDVAVVISASGNPKYLLGVLSKADEIGTKEDLEAINYGICSGVKGIFTAHGSDINELRQNDALNKLYEEKLFKRIIFLENRGKMGKVYYLDRNMYKTVDGKLV